MPFSCMLIKNTKEPNKALIFKILDVRINFLLLISGIDDFVDSKQNFENLSQSIA